MPSAIRNGFSQIRLPCPPTVSIVDSSLPMIPGSKTTFPWSAGVGRSGRPSQSDNPRWHSGVATGRADACSRW